MRTDAATKDYVARRKAEREKRTEIIRCLKRHIAREVYRRLTNPPPTPNCATGANRPTSPSPEPLTNSEPNPAASRHSNSAETTTITSPPDTRNS